MTRYTVLVIVDCLGDCLRVAHVPYVDTSGLYLIASPSLEEGNFLHTASLQDLAIDRTLGWFYCLSP